MAKRKKRPLTEEDLEAIWRGDPNFIGPVGPPGVLWLRDREAQRQWEIDMNLRPQEKRDAISPS